MILLSFKLFDVDDVDKWLFIFLKKASGLGLISAKRYMVRRAFNLQYQF